MELLVMYLQIRQRDVVLQFSTQGKQPMPSGINVRIEQISRSFPLGSCINRWSLDNSSYRKFFLENFNWAVFENEIKWGWTEPQQGMVNISTSWLWVMGIVWHWLHPCTLQHCMSWVLLGTIHNYDPHSAFLFFVDSTITRMQTNVWSFVYRTAYPCEATASTGK